MVTPPPVPTSATDSALDVLTAWGTVGAVVVALLIALGGWGWRRWSQPRLSLAIDSSPQTGNDLVVTLAEVRRGQFTQQGRLGWVLGRVSSSRSTAHGAEVVVQRAWLRSGRQQETRALSGYSMKWSGEVGAEGTIKSTIPRGVERHIDIASTELLPLQAGTTANRTPLVLATAHQLADGPHAFASGRITLDLALASENGPASYYRLVIDYEPPEVSLGVDPWDYLKVVSLRKLSSLRDAPEPS